MAGTAPHTRVWIGIEQSGPWGSEALLESHLPLGLGAELAERFADPTIRVLLLRRPGTHADARSADPASHQRTVLVAFTGIDGRRAPWLVTTQCVGDAELAAAMGDLDPAALLEGTRPGPRWSDSQDRPTLICTNGRRDTCCAISGRLLLDDVVAGVDATGAPSTVWECSHPGGHRFAPTVVLLPSGFVLGRAMADDVMQAMQGTLPVHVLRGRSALTSAQQAAELAVLEELPFPPISGLEVTDAGTGAAVQVQEAGGTRWNVETHPVVQQLERPVSCGKADEPISVWNTRITIPE